MGRSPPRSKRGPYANSGTEANFMPDMDGVILAAIAVS